MINSARQKSGLQKGFVTTITQWVRNLPGFHLTTVKMDRLNQKIMQEIN